MRQRNNETSTQNGKLLLSDPLCPLPHSSPVLLKRHVLILRRVRLVRVVQRELLRAVQDVVHRLDPHHATVVLVADLVLPAPKPPAAPDAVLLQEGQRLLERTVPLHARRRVPALQAPVVGAHNLIRPRDQLRVHAALDALLQDRRHVDGLGNRFGGVSPSKLVR